MTQRSITELSDQFVCHTCRKALSGFDAPPFIRMVFGRYGPFDELVSLTFNTFCSEKCLNTGVCDFCDAKSPVLKTYETTDSIATYRQHTESGRTMTVDSVMEGGWEACPDCAALIDKEDKLGLAVRTAKSIETSRRRKGEFALPADVNLEEYRRSTIEYLVQFHTMQFWSKRK